MAHQFREEKPGDDVGKDKAFKSAATVWAWGWNSNGERGTGNGTTNATTVPVQVVGQTNPAAVSGGYNFCIAQMPDGSVYE